MKIAGTGKYLPKKKIQNSELETKFQVEKGFIHQRTGIKTRYYVENETIEEMAIQAVKNLYQKTKFKKEEIGLIIVATNSTNKLMPGIANGIQKNMQIPSCICFDILAGCSGYINAFEMANLYIKAKKIKKAIIIGVDLLSAYTDLEDIGTAIVLSDGAGATLLQETKIDKKYESVIECLSENSEILTCKTNGKIQMDGTKVYKYAVTETIKSIQKLLEQAGESIDKIKYIIPHQSNQKIMKAIANRLKINPDKMYCNIETVGNTFCASIPIVLDEMIEQKKLLKGDKIILLGYGAGLNTGSILFEI